MAGAATVPYLSSAMSTIASLATTSPGDAMGLAFNALLALTQQREDNGANEDGNNNDNDEDWTALNELIDRM